jgi:hypothetical protein
MDLKPGVFRLKSRHRGGAQAIIGKEYSTQGDPLALGAIHAECRDRHGGKNLTHKRKSALNQAKQERRRRFGRPAQLKWRIAAQV